MPIYDLDRIICDNDYQATLSSVEEDLVITELPKDVCMCCGRKYPHRKINWVSSYEGLKEVEFILECCGCRSDKKKIKELKKKIETIEEQILNIEFNKFSRKYNIVKNT